MDPFRTNTLGRCGIGVTALGFGGGGIASLYTPLPEERGIAIVGEAYARGIRYFDTAPFYGHTSSERRLGAALAAYPANEYVLSTKVGRTVRRIDGPRRQPGVFADDEPYEMVFDYSRDGVRRSVEGSLERLQRDAVDILFIHDVHNEAHFREAVEQTYPTLVELKEAGLTRAIGAGIGDWRMCRRLAEAVDLDCLLLALRYTLADHAEALHGLLPLCEARGIGVVCGAPLYSGILATGATAGARAGYRPASEALLERVRRMEAVCGRYGVPLVAAALQFPLGHRCVASVIPGMSSLDELSANIAAMRVEIPADCWAELKAEGLIDAAAPTP